MTGQPIVSASSEDPSPEQLMAMAMAGDNVAYNKVLRHISTYLSSRFSRKIPPKDRDDVIQNVLLSIHKARHTYDSSRPLMPWVMAIARYRLTDYWRQHYGHALDETIDIEDIKNILSVDETKTLNTREDITRGIKHLSPIQQEIIDLMYRQDKSVQEVADALSMSLSAVKVAAHRSYKVLRKRLME